MTMKATTRARPTYLITPDASFRITAQRVGESTQCEVEMTVGDNTVRIDIAGSELIRCIADSVHLVCYSGPKLTR